VFHWLLGIALGDNLGLVPPSPLSSTNASFPNRL